MTNQLPDSVVDATRKRLKDYLEAHAGVCLADVAAHTTLSDTAVRHFCSVQVRGGKEIVGEINRVLDLAEAGEILQGGRQALTVTEDQAARPRRVKRSQNFYTTETFRRIAMVLDYCAEHATIGVVSADYGVGKTESVRAWRKGAGKRVDCLVFEFDDFSASNKVDFVAQLALMLGIEARGSGPSIFRAVCAALRERPCLLIFDQCELVRVRIFQIIRQIWDRTAEAGVGVVLLAAPILVTRMQGSRMADLGALSSRVGIWAPLAGLTRGEMAAIVQKEGIKEITPDALDLWWRATGGSMRRLRRMLDLLQAKHAGKLVTERTIAEAAGHLWGMQLAAGEAA